MSDGIFQQTISLYKVTFLQVFYSEDIDKVRKKLSCDFDLSSLKALSMHCFAWTFPRIFTFPRVSFAFSLASLVSKTQVKT